MAEQWYVKCKKNDFDKLGKEFNLSPYLMRVLTNRGIDTRKQIQMFLYGTIENIHDPYLMKDAKKGAEIIYQKIKDNLKIRVIGDYDVDGVTASFILEKTLLLLGADVDVVIPHRVHDGYGLNPSLIENAYADHVDTILTCDNGISAHEEIQMAKDKGMTVIVTDHHDIPYDIIELEDGTSQKADNCPNADAVINPKQQCCPYPFKEICGAVVAYKLSQILCDIAKENNDITEKQKEQHMKEMLEFAALGTTCDVMPLIDENHIIVKEGLKLLGHSNNLGMRCLIEALGLGQKEITCYHLGFVIGPSINAAGRIDSAARGLECFETTKEREAVKIASELKALNEYRKSMTEDGILEGIKQVEILFGQKGGKESNTVLVVYLPKCHESIAGIIAGRLKEEYQRPCLVLTDSEGVLKGSGRSIEAYHMRDALVKVSDLLIKFGGHKLAAGFSLPKENLEEFKKRLNQDANLSEKDFVKKVEIDMELPIGNMDLDFVETLNLLSPYGTGNPTPQFVQKNISVSNLSIFGEKMNVARCTLTDEFGSRKTGVYFGDACQFKKDTSDGNKICAVYSPQINEYRGNKSVQIQIKNYKLMP